MVPLRATLVLLVTPFLILAVMLRLLPEFMRGTHEHFRQIRTGQFTHMEVEASQPLTIHTDGEVYAGFGTNIRRLTIEIMPKALRIIAPQVGTGAEKPQAEIAKELPEPVSPVTH